MSGTTDSTPSTFPHKDSMDVACRPGEDGQEVWQCQTETDVGAVVAPDAVSFGSALPHSYRLTLVQRVQLPKALRRK